MKSTLNPMKLGRTALIIVGFLFAFLLDLLLVYPALDHLLDFGSFIAAGRAAKAGNNPYESDLPLVYHFLSREIGAVKSPNLNPPITVLIFETIANPDPIISVTICRIATLLLYTCVVLILLREYSFSNTRTRIIWAFSLAGLWHVLQLGQIYAPILLIVIGTWLFLERGYLNVAGITLGLLIAIKPNFVLWALLLGLAGYWSTFLFAGLVSASISLIPIIIYGLRVYRQWLEAISEFEPIGLLLPGNNSLPSLVTRVGVGQYTWVVSILVIGLAVYLAFQHRKDFQRLNTLGIVASLLVSPIAWTGYTMLCLPMFFSRNKWPWQYLVAAAFFSFPYFMILALFEDSGFNFLFFGWFYGWGLLLVFLELFTKRRKTDAVQDSVSD